MVAFRVSVWKNLHSLPCYLRSMFKVTGTPVPCSLGAGDCLVINRLVLDTACKQGAWARVSGRGERVQRPSLGTVWSWVMSLCP